MSSFTQIKKHSKGYFCVEVTIGTLVEAVLSGLRKKSGSRIATSLELPNAARPSTKIDVWVPASILEHALPEMVEGFQYNRRPKTRKSLPKFFEATEGLSPVSTSFIFMHEFDSDQLIRCYRNFRAHQTLHALRVVLGPGRLGTPRSPRHGWPILDMVEWFQMMILSQRFSGILRTTLLT